MLTPLEDCGGLGTEEEEEEEEGCVGGEGTEASEVKTAEDGGECFWYWYKGES